MFDWIKKSNSNFFPQPNPTFYILWNTLYNMLDPYLLPSYNVWKNSTLLLVPVYVEDTEYLGIYKQRYIQGVFDKKFEGSVETLYINVKVHLCEETNKIGFVKLY